MNSSFTALCLRLFLFTGIIACQFSASAQDILDANNDLLATQSGDSLFDSNQQLLFTIDSQGNVKDAAGQAAGSFDGQGKVYDINNDQIGELKNNGKVYDSNGDQLGQINNNGSITDMNSFSFATFSGVADDKLAWFLFFNDSGIGF